MSRRQSKRKKLSSEDKDSTTGKPKKLKQTAEKEVQNKPLSPTS